MGVWPQNWSSALVDENELCLGAVVTLFRSLVSLDLFNLDFGGREEVLRLTAFVST